jgi:hypothetical protein
MARSGLTTERLWEERLRRFELSGSSVAAFCRREGVSREAFDFWRSRLGVDRASTPLKQPARRQRTNRQAAQGFLPVDIVGAATMEICLPNGVRLLVPASDRAVLETAIAAVGRLPAARSKEVEPC